MDKAENLEELRFFISRILNSKTVRIKNGVVYFSATKKVGVAAKQVIENNYVNVDVNIKFEQSPNSFIFNAKINNDKLTPITEVEIIKTIIEKYGIDIYYKSNHMEVSDGLIKVKTGFLDKESFDFFIEIGFTIVEL